MVLYIVFIYFEGGDPEYVTSFFSIGSGSILYKFLKNFKFVKENNKSIYKKLKICQIEKININEKLGKKIRSPMVFVNTLPWMEEELQQFESLINSG